MKHSRACRVTMALLSAVLIGAWMLPLTALAQDQQGAGVDAPAGKPSPSEGAGPETGQTPAKSPADKKTDEQTGGSAPGSEPKPLRYSAEAVAIAALMILVLGLLFVVQLFYSQRLDQTSYLGEIFRESVFNFEFNRLAAPHRENWANRTYLREAATKEPPQPLDERLQELDDKWGYRELQHRRDRAFNEAIGLDPWSMEGSGGLGTSPPPGLNRRPGENKTLSPQEQNDFNEYEQKAKDFKSGLQEWMQKITQNARTAYDKHLDEDKKKAAERTKAAVGSTETSLLRGQGPQFVLEFTALIVIIFSAVVLGVLGRLSDQQIGTLLAAIAGYVLGRATAARGSASEGKSGG